MPAPTRKESRPDQVGTAFGQSRAVRAYFIRRLRMQLSIPNTPVLKSSSVVGSGMASISMLPQK